MVPTVGEAAFVDTNVLLTATDESRPHHRMAQRLLSESAANGLRLAASGQILREYLVVATRPVDANGLGLGVPAVAANVEEFLRHLHLHDETAEGARRLRRLTVRHGVRGKRLHDANIVAAMSAHRIAANLTQNRGDFVRFEGIRSVAIPEATAWLDAPDPAGG